MERGRITQRVGADRDPPLPFNPEPTTYDAPNINRLWADLLVEELIRNGIDRFCLSPGSRSTPLATAVAAHPRAQPYVHVDERGSAFFALGLARATGRPAAWITTSGTAVANGLPAVVEAAMDGVPLLALTGDRPPELRATAANQTIDQVKLFGDYLNWFFDLPCPTLAIGPAMLLTTIDQAIFRTLYPPGPVHLNAMFREPLAPQPDGRDLDAYTTSLSGWRRSNTPYTRYAPVRPTTDPAQIDALAAEIRGIDRGLIVAGRLPFDTAEAPHLLARALGWPLFPDIRSGLRLGPQGSHTVPYFDTLLASEAFRDDARPEAVLVVGGLPTSKRLLQFLDAAPLRLLAVVSDRPIRIDPSHRATHRIQADPAGFCTTLAHALGSKPDSPDARTRALTTASQRFNTVLNEALDGPDLAEPAVARLVARHLPAGHGLVLGNSMPIRDMDQFAAVDGSNVPVAANRGASGIDGTIATAAGFAAGLGRPVTLLLGDLAALYDLNALAYLQRVPVVCIVINNNGGGIFSFLPIAQFHDVFEPYFGTPHGLGFAEAAQMYGLPYEQPATQGDFLTAYRAACARDGSTVIEVRTDRTENVALHRSLLERAARPGGQGT